MTILMIELDWDFVVVVVAVVVVDLLVVVVESDCLSWTCHCHTRAYLNQTD